jgi:uncharacterized protein YyaL (SSP411 family)
MLHPARLATFAAFCLSMLPLRSAGVAWTTDFEAARQRAAAEDKTLLVDFTGSDWCSWCIKLREEVFDQAEFGPLVRDRFVMVELDYPKDKSRVTEAVAIQNAALLKKYPISGYPTVLLCDGDGKPFATTGYQPGGPAAYSAHLLELLARKSSRDRAFTEASAKTGLEKAKMLIAALDAMELGGDLTTVSYPEIAAQITAADPADETGFVRKQAVEVQLAEFLKELAVHRSKQDLDGALKMIEETLANPATRGEFRQQVYGHHAGTLAYAGKKDEAIEVLKKAVDEDPQGKRTAELKNFITILEREKAGLPRAAPKAATE